MILGSALLAAPSLSVAQPPAGVGGPPPAMPVEAAKVRVENLSIEINAVGSLVANEALTLRPEIAGRITEIHFKEGDSVSAGDKLVSLDAGEYRARLDESTAQLKIRQVSYERASRLREKNLVSIQEYDQEAALLDEAKARQALDADRLKKTVLMAPFNGIIGLRRVSPGQFVEVGDDLVELADIGALKLDFQVPEVNLSEVRTGLDLSVQVDAFPSDTFHGRVYAIAPGLEVASRSVMLRARVPNLDGRLRPGMFARVKLKVAQRDNAILVPEEAIWPIGKDKFVYRVVDGKAVLTKVGLGYRRFGEVEVREGLGPQDMVVTAGHMKIRDGASVMVINQPPPAKPG